MGGKDSKEELFGANWLRKQRGARRSYRKDISSKPPQDVLRDSRFQVISLGSVLGKNQNNEALF